MDSPGLREFPFVPGQFKVTDEMQKAYEWDGAIVVKNLLGREELDKIIAAIEASNELRNDWAFEVSDGMGRGSKLVLWNQPGTDITGVLARVEKVAKTCETLLGGECYHYHTKLLMKEARTGGSHLWHQDYGYWYKNGLLRPDVVTVFIALDPCVKENGCLQIIKGSNRCGRIEHHQSTKHGQTEADLERVAEIRKNFQHMHAELQAGDAMFFHANLLHTSDQNDSDMRRWGFIISYNRADNDPVYIHHHAQYTPLHIVPDSALLECQNTTDFSGKDFMDPKQDKTINSELK